MHVVFLRKSFSELNIIYFNLLYSCRVVWRADPEFLIYLPTLHNFENSYNNTLYIFLAFSRKFIFSSFSGVFH